MTQPHAELVEDERLTSPEAIEDFALQEDYALNPEFVQLVVDAADRGDGLRLRELLGALHPADVADLMGFLSQGQRAQVTPWIPSDLLAEVLPELDDRIRDEVLEHVPSGVLAEALQELDSDDAAAVVEDLDEADRRAVLAAMPDVERAAIESSLAYEEETAGRLMQREVLAAPQFWTVGQAIDHVRGQDDSLPELFFDIYVVDPGFKPVGAVPVSRLLRSRRETTLAEIMEPVTEIAWDLDQEEVAYIFEKYHLISAPVVDAGGRLVGQITVDDIVNIIQEENREDILALAGVSDAGRDASVAGSVRARLPWLALNLVTSAISVSSIALFQDEVARVVALAVLMPIVSAVGGNAGTQTLAVAVRALASRELTTANARREVLREIGVGLTNGLSLAALLAGATFAFWRDPSLSLVAGLALVINICVAAMAGILAPLTLERLGRDPAVSSSIFVTFLTDFSGFFAVLTIAAVLMR